MTEPDHVAAEMGELVQDTSPGEFDRFYDRLRRRIRESVERRVGRVGEKASEALLVVPDVFMLMVRLTMDRKVPEQARAVIGGALAYFILPADLFPEMVLGAPGYIDDVVVAAILCRAGDHGAQVNRSQWRASRSAAFRRGVEHIEARSWRPCWPPSASGSRAGPRCTRAST